MTIVYRLFDEDDALLYVGMTADLECRLIDHRKHRAWADRIARVEVFAECGTPEEAHRVEIRAIRDGVPLHNIEHNWARRPPMVQAAS